MNAWNVRRCVVAGLVAPMTLLAVHAYAQAISVGRTRDAVTRAIAAIQVAQQTSLKTQQCSTTCHLQLYGALSYRAAVDHGIEVDHDLVRRDFARSLGRPDDDLSRAVEDHGRSEVAMNRGFAMVAAHAAGRRPSLVAAAMARGIALQQNPAGDWTALYTRPPSNSSSFTFTALSMRALQLYGHPLAKTDTDARANRAVAWMRSHAAINTEDRTYQLLGLWWGGADSRERKQLASRLLATQQADGGWNSRDGRGSDAYSTGEALVALHDAGATAVTTPAWRRGMTYLLRNQAADGTWHVRTRLPPWVSPPYFESGYPYGRDQFISIEAAHWAVMALTRLLPEVAPTAPLPLASLEEPQVDQWTETAMFGTVDDLRTLLDQGLSPNAFTEQGHIPLLSLVVPDGGKTSLLISRGADVNAQSLKHFSPLVIASQYLSGTSAAKALLAAGATVRARSGVRVAAFPTFLAARVGNAELLRVFHDAGDPLEDTAVGIGGGATTPLTVAVQLDQLAAVDTLAALGADVTDPLALDLAVSGNRLEIVRHLLNEGADPNQADRQGITPLAYAAASDFGDATVTKLLLAWGADPLLRDQSGQTPLDRARERGNTAVIAVLERAERDRRTKTQ
jgi:N-acyl-D-amino-acid deacylase